MALDDLRKSIGYAQHESDSARPPVLGSFMCMSARVRQFDRRIIHPYTHLSGTQSRTCIRHRKRNANAVLPRSHPLKPQVSVANLR